MTNHMINVNILLYIPIIHFYVSTLISAINLTQLIIQHAALHKLKNAHI